MATTAIGCHDLEEDRWAMWSVTFETHIAACY